MRMFKVSDELYEQLKSFVVDPFDDTPDAVIGRLIEIVNKAKNRWSPFEEEEEKEEPKNAYESFPASPKPRHQEQEQEKNIDEVVLL